MIICGCGWVADSDTSLTFIGEEYREIKVITPMQIGDWAAVSHGISKIKPGDTVTDLGSGAGNDAL